METYDEWRLIFDVGKPDGIDRVVEEAASRVPEDVGVHRRGDQVVVYGFTEDATRAVGNLLLEP